MPSGAQAGSRQKVDLHRTINNIIVSVLGEMGFETCAVTVSARTLKDIVTHYQADIEKLKDHQNDSIALSKRIAGLAFWIRRLKPISCAYLNGREIQDVNEQVCLRIAVRLLIATASDPRHCAVMKGVAAAGKTANFTRYMTRFWSADKHSSYTNLIYSLRYRNWSPHHLAIFFESLFTGFAISEGIV